VKDLKVIVLRVLAGCLLASCVATAWAADLQLQQLMGTLSQKKWGTASFVEKKYLSIIDKPIVSTGILTFVAPNFLQKRTLSPRPETLTLAGDMLTIEQPGKSQHKVSLEEYPEAAAFIESIRGTLSGDLAALQKYYEIGLSGTDENWILKLNPKDEKFSQIFSQIRIVGSRDEVKSIEIDQRDGDHSVMSITDSSR